MGWNIAPLNFEMVLNAKVPAFIGEKISGFVSQVSAKLHTDINTIGKWAVHPGGRKILDVVKENLKLSDDKMANSYQVLNDHGNMSSPTILFILELIMEAPPEPGEKIFAIGFGRESVWTQRYLPMTDRFDHRSSQSEMLDTPDIPKDLLEQNLRELDFLNRWLNGHAISMEGLKKLVKDKKSSYRVIDIGCGSGDVLKLMARWARKHGFSIQLTGIDKNPDAIEFLRKHCGSYPEIDGIACGYADFLKQEHPVDIIHASLFCHHLPDEELVGFFRKVNAIAQNGFIVNDLQRTPLAYYGAKLMTGLLNGSSLSKNDGPISVLRAFKQYELEQLLKRAGVRNFTICRRWPFRFLVIGGQRYQHGRK